MTVKVLTNKPTEADLEAEVHCALKAAFPWLKTEELKHQVKFSFAFGRTPIEVDGTSVSRHEARSDILIYHGEKPLAVLELKRNGVNLTDNDRDQGLSYARMLHPRPPLVIVTNGKELSILATHTGENWEPTNPSEDELAKLIMAVCHIAEAEIKNAVEVLLGPSSTIWATAIRASTTCTIEDLTGEWSDSLLPFVSNFLIPRHATGKIVAELKGGNKRIVILKGPPLIGKSCVLCELCKKTALDDDLVILFIESDGSSGSGVIQIIANLLAESLGWSISLDDTRTWLRRLSRGNGPTLVLAIDGVGIIRDEIRRDIEELTSDSYGEKLRIVLAVDEAIVERLILNETRRKKTQIGRRSNVVSVDPLDDQEFLDAENYLWQKHHIGIMKGGNSATEFRIPWILRALVSSYICEQKYIDGHYPVIPSLLGLDTIDFVRKRFHDSHELRRLYQELAQAVLRESNDTSRPISLILESISVFIVRRDTLKKIMATEDISNLEQNGYLKSRMHECNEYIIVPRIPELLISEISYLLGKELKVKISKDENRAGDWLVNRTSKLPLGDLIGAQAILDFFSSHSHIPLNFISHLITIRPNSNSVLPGTRASLHVPGAGLVDLLFKEDGSIQAYFGGHMTKIENDNDQADHVMHADVESWLILSHLSRYQLLAQSKDGQIIGRIDPAILMEIGTCQIILRRPTDQIGIMTHDLPGLGSVVCHNAGIVEPITMAILQFLSNEGDLSTGWLEEAIDRKSFPLLARIHIALEQLAGMDDKKRANWANDMITNHINPAFKRFPPLH